MEITCFKAYDVRGRIPDQLNEDIAWRIGRAYAQFLNPKRVAIGRDIRLTSPAIQDAVTRGLTDSGVDVFDIGVGGTEEIYFVTADQGFDGGIMVTASHNPADYNGLKFVREDSRPISGDTGLTDIRALAEAGEFPEPTHTGSVRSINVRDAYIEHLLSYIDRDVLKPLKIIVNPGNGGAGLVVDALEPNLPFELVKVHFEPDGNFPNGIPNPLLPENRAATTDAILASRAALGIAWDGDFDRCFLFDEQGGFIEGYYIVGVLAEQFLIAQPGASIIYDPRLTWNTVDIVESNGGKPVISKAGHAFIKETMRRENAVYGGEMSAHHYFRDFAYCDSGMIPWLLVAELLSRTGQPLSQLVAERMQRFPSSGEINRHIENPAAVLADLKERYRDEAVSIDELDGLSMEFTDWRFNLRPSNTEPVVRLNVESRADPALMRAKTEELLAALGTD